jgi:ribonuclease HII
MLWIGLDEAGYGPTLGPLTIGLTAWKVPSAVPPEDLYERLAGIVTAQAPRNVLALASSRGRIAAPVLWIADSKVIYQPGRLKPLEEVVLLCLALAQGTAVQNCRELCTALLHAEIPPAAAAWDWEHALQLPLAAEAIDLCCAKRLREAISQREAELLAFRVRPLFPAEYNAALATHAGNKSLVLFHAGMEVVRDLLQAYPDELVWIDADKQGGRDRYAALLQQVFCDDWIEVLQESHRESMYRWGKPAARRWLRIRVRGEQSLPVAAASLAAKYVREVSLHCLNKFWSAEVRDLRPTAGYPLDAARFIQQIRKRQKRLKIHDAEFIRMK